MRKVIFYKTAEERKKDYFRRKRQAMKDLQSYVKERKARDLEFSQDYESGYADFKIGAMLRAARLRTKKTAVSRIENHAQNMKLSTLAKFAQAFGKTLRIEVL